MQVPSFDFVKKLYKEFPKAEAYLVGGIVRDLILKRKSQDYDFVIRNVASKELERFLKKQGRVDLVGKHFGIFKFRPKGWDGEEIEIALPRSEKGWGTGKYQDFDIQTDPKLPIEKDLSRRDFTWNAMALDLRTGELIDPFNGVGDLKKKIIRTVGSANKRFCEDYSRMFRAIRFSCELGFTIESKTKNTIKKFIPKVQDIKKDGTQVTPYELIAPELVKSFTCDPSKAFRLCDKLGVFKILIPEILKAKGCPQPKNFHSEGDVWSHIKLTMDNLKLKKWERDPTLVFAVLLHDIAKAYTIKTPEKDGVDRIRFDEHDSMGALIARKISKRLKLATAGVDCDEISWMTGHHLLIIHGKVEKMKNTTIEKYFLNPLHNGERFIKLMTIDALSTIPEKGKPNLRNIKKVIKRVGEIKKLSETKTEAPKPILSGHEIMKVLKLKPGPKIGELKELLREEQLKKRVKTKKEAVEFLRKQF